MDGKELANKVIDGLGGTSATARLCEIKVPSVCEWRHNGIPKPWIKYFQAIRPDLFDTSAVSSGETETACVPHQES